MSSNDFIVFGSPQIARDEIDEVVATMESGWLGSGPRVVQFESDFAAYKRVSKENVAAVNSCTAALHVSLIAANVGVGDEVITTAMTFCATVNAIIHAGATPVLVDIDGNSWNIDHTKIEAKITSKTKALVIVHYAGRSCEMNQILTIVKKHNLILIEDCAHAIETEYHGKKAGTFGDFSCFSFYVTKNMTTAEGGMVIAKNEQLAGRVRRLALHGLSKDAWQRFSDKGYKHYYVEECGFKYNMTDLQAAIGIHQLKRIETNWQRRELLWKHYQSSFDKLSITVPEQPNIHSRHGYHLYTVLIDKEKCGLTRDEVLEKMTEAKIGVGVHYLCIADHPYYQKNFGWKSEDTPVAANVGNTTLSLPLSAKLTDEHVNRIVSEFTKIIKG